MKLVAQRSKQLTLLSDYESPADTECDELQDKFFLLYVRVF